MKKVFILLIFCTSISFYGNAQIRIGLEAGANASGMKREFSGFSASNTNRLSYKAGAIVDIPIYKENVSIQPGIFYTARGSELYADFTIADFSLIQVKQIMHVNYIEVPVNIQYKQGEAGKGKLFVGAGPYFGYAATGRVTTTVSGNSIVKSIISLTGLVDFDEGEKDLRVGTDSNDHIRPFDIGINANMGYEFPIGIIIRGQIGTGLMNTAPNQDVNEQRNWGGSLSIAYTFGFRKKEKINNN